MAKKELCILLSKLRVFESPNMLLEQYPTDSEVAGDALWNAHMREDIKGKIVADLGAGTGILGLGACVLGAKKAVLVDSDKEALQIVNQNKILLEETLRTKFDIELINSDISSFQGTADVLFMNPPFGTKDEHADTNFLLRAFKIAPIIYSFHKASTKHYIDKLIKQNGFAVTHYVEYNFPLKKTMAHHKKRIERVRVGLWRMERLSR
jgi:putative methylase